VPESGRPLFLKMVYHGPRWTEELARYDPQLVIGILGGASGTTYDAFKLLAEAQKYGARVALFGRKINNAEHQLAFVEMLRRIVDGQISPEEAVHAYHGVLQGLGLKPHRSLEDDRKLQTAVMSYGATATGVTVPPTAPQPSQVASAVPAAPKPAGVRPVNAAPIVTGAGAPGREAASVETARSYPRLANGSPDFNSMSPHERLAYHRARLANL